MTENIKDSFDISDADLDNILAGITDTTGPAENLTEEGEGEVVPLTEADIGSEENKDSDGNIAEPPEDNPTDVFTEGEEEPKEPQEPQEPTEELEDVDVGFYKETFEKIFAPFKASGKEIQVKTADEVIKLMKMGADYYNKTQKHAGDVRLAATLKNAGLDDTEKLNFLIDVMNNEKGAVKKFLAQIEYEHDYSDEETGEYVPKNHSVSDSEIAMRAVLAEGKNDPAFQSMIKEVTSWDAQSRAVFSSHPEMLNILADNYRSGAYQQVMAEVDRQRMLGDLNGLSTLQAYRQVVNDLAASANLNTRNSEVAPQPTKATSTVQDKRRALSPSPRGKVSNSPKIDNLYDLSDEEIMKLAL